MTPRIQIVQMLLLYSFNRHRVALLCQDGAPCPRLLRGPELLVPVHGRDRTQVHRDGGRPHHRHVRTPLRPLLLHGAVLHPRPPHPLLRHTPGAQHGGHPTLQQHQGHGERLQGRGRHPRHPTRVMLLL